MKNKYQSGDFTEKRKIYHFLISKVTQLNELILRKISEKTLFLLDRKLLTNQIILRIKKNPFLIRLNVIFISSLKTILFELQRF